MPDDDFEFPRLDRTALSVVPLEDDTGDREYWWSRDPEERLEHVEMLRRINYGDAATVRLQRVLDITRVEWR